MCFRLIWSGLRSGEDRHSAQCLRSVQLTLICPVLAPWLVCRCATTTCEAQCLSVYPCLDNQAGSPEIWAPVALFVGQDQQIKSKVSVLPWTTFDRRQLHFCHKSLSRFSLCNCSVSVEEDIKLQSACMPWVIKADGSDGCKQLHEKCISVSAVQLWEQRAPTKWKSVNFPTSVFK